PDLYLVLQNVSTAPIRLSDANIAPNVNLRMLYLKFGGKTQMGLGARVPRLGDLMLQPGEVAFLKMFSPDAKGSDGQTMGSIIAQGTLIDAHQSLVAELKIDQAPTGAWTGKLVTGETSGAAAETPK